MKNIIENALTAFVPIPTTQKEAMVKYVLNHCGMVADKDVVDQGMQDDDNYVLVAYHQAASLRQKVLQGTC